MIRERKAQSALWGLLATLILALLAGGLVDIYRLYAARTWAYSIAQEAALTGASRGRDWDSVAETGWIRLNRSAASREAESRVEAAMQERGIHGYRVIIEVLQEPFGGTVTGFPPSPVRLGEDRNDWSSAEPAVGVYLEVPVEWTLLDIFGLDAKTVRAFASAGVAQ